MTIEMRLLTMLFLLLTATWAMLIAKYFELRDELREVEDYTANSIRRVENLKNEKYKAFIFTKVTAEDKCRPYKDTDEMLEDFKSRAGYYSGVSFASENPMLHISIWIKNKKTGCLCLVTDYLERIVFCSENRYTVEELFDNYTYLDGTPCGKKEE